MNTTIDLTKSMIGKYSITDKLGEGACKIAYLAENKLTREKVCLSIFRNIERPGFEKHDYESEIASGCTAFDHVNVLKTLDHGHANFSRVGQIDRKVYFIVTEFCVKGDLYDLVETLKGANEPIAKLLFKQVLDGLSYLHTNGVAHLDMKLDNCFIDESMTVKVADFGFSEKFIGQSLTRKCGSEGKMAPELLAGGEYDGQAVDVFASGVLLFEMLTS